MKKILALLFVLSQLSLSIHAQKVTGQQAFTVNYPINRYGYPLQIVPNKDGAISYIEFWNPGEGRQEANFYLQTLDKKYEELWFKPVTRQGASKLTDISEVMRLKNTIAVIGHQYSPSIKREATKMQIFSLDGAPNRGLAVLSNYTKKAKKGYEDMLAVAPDRSKLLWLGHNPGAKYKKRSFYASVWSDKGTKVWARKLFLQPQEEKYLVSQTAVDKRGNAYFYMVYEELKNAAEDTLHPPIIVRYDHKENKYTRHDLKFSNTSVPEGKIYVTEKGDLAFLGVLADGSDEGFINGAKRFETGLKWNKLIYQQFNVERELQLKQDTVMAFPGSWLKKYGGDRGANFSKMEIVEHKDNLYWVMEEFYTQIHNGQPQFLYYDIGVIAIDMASGEINWASIVDKKQRDYKSGRMLSYTMGIASGALRFVYLNERGAQGKIVCKSVNLNTGEVERKPLASNAKANNLFFPRRSAMVDENKMVLMGVGNPVGNDYKLIEVTFE